MTPLTIFELDVELVTHG